MVRKKTNKYEDMSISQLKKIYEECLNTIKEIEEVFKEAPIFTNLNKQNNISNNKFNYSDISQRSNYISPTTNLYKPEANTNTNIKEEKPKVVIDGGFILEAVDPLEEPFDVNNRTPFKGFKNEITEYNEPLGIDVYSPNSNDETEEVLDPQEEVNRQLENIKQSYSELTEQPDI